MALILGAVAASGVLASRLLLLCRVRSLPLRYGLTVTIAYACFFLLIRLWLRFIAKQIEAQRRGYVETSSSSHRVVDALDASGIPSSGSNASATSPYGGGTSGGGGASGLFDEPAPSPSYVEAEAGAKKALGLFDIDDGAIVLIALAALAAVLLGAGVYTVWQAPLILSEAAFEILLASSLLRPSRRLEARGWASGVFSATILPAGIVLAVAVAFGFVVQKYCPGVGRISQVPACIRMLDEPPAR